MSVVVITDCCTLAVADMTWGSEIGSLTMDGACPVGDRQSVTGRDHLGITRLHSPNKNRVWRNQSDAGICHDFRA